MQCFLRIDFEIFTSVMEYTHSPSHHLGKTFDNINWNQVFERARLDNPTQTMFSLKSAGHSTLFRTLLSKVFPSSPVKAVASAWTRVFPRALVTGDMFSRNLHRLHVFPGLAPVTGFPALVAGYMYCIPALVTSYMFSSACRCLHVFPSPATSCMFPALVTGCILPLLIGFLSYLRLL